MTGRNRLRASAWIGRARLRGLALGVPQPEKPSDGCRGERHEAEVGSPCSVYRGTLKPLGDGTAARYPIATTA